MRAELGLSPAEDPGAIAYDLAARLSAIWIDPEEQLTAELKAEFYGDD
jgi:hypothetical protein